MRLSGAFFVGSVVVAALAAGDEGVAERPASAPEGAQAGAGTAASATESALSPRRAGPYHAITVALCARAADLCAGAQATGETRADYAVVFGSGAGTLRTRSQAMADLYKELRDRTSWGTHLTARPHHLELAPDASVPSSSAVPRAETTPDPDPLVAASFELMTVVDTDGEITIDTTSSYGACKLALADATDADGGAARCFIAVEKPSGGGGGRRR
jgi:hypothetical protein